MSEPVDIQIAKRSEMFVPDEFRLLVYVGSKFDCLQTENSKYAHELWEASKKSELFKNKQACKNLPVEELNKRVKVIEEKFEASKAADIERYTKDLKNFKPLASLPLCVSDGRKFLQYAMTTFHVPIKHCALMCSKEDYIHIVNKFKDWSDEESKEPKEENGIVNEWEDAISKQQHDDWIDIPAGNKGTTYVQEHLLPLVKFRYSQIGQLIDDAAWKELTSKLIPPPIAPNRANYNDYLNGIVKEAKNAKSKSFVSVQFFASHGYIKNGYQAIAANAFDARANFFEMIDVEQQVRLNAA